MMVVALNDFLTPTEAAGDSNARDGGRKKGRKGSRKGSRKGCRKGGIPTWLEDATGGTLETNFANAWEKANASVQTLGKTTSVSKMSDETLVKKCSKLFNSALNHREGNYTQGLADIVQRLESFFSLIQRADQTVLQRGANSKLSKDLRQPVKYVRQMKDAVYYYLSGLRTACDNQARNRSEQDCRARSDRQRYMCQLDASDNEGHWKEQALIISKQLQNFLQALRSFKRVPCKRQGPRQKGDKEKGKHRKARKGPYHRDVTTAFCKLVARPVSP
ncbi:uncharacterized protein LOC143296019 [Babylonia areolata]|uniref:uncharacterized protein LOC143296019 n=1 Tax=Babylonia areolata TaxID=304850 RepID=UPI003FD0DD94